MEWTCDDCGEVNVLSIGESATEMQVPGTFRCTAEVARGPVEVEGEGRRFARITSCDGRLTHSETVWILVVQDERGRIIDMEVRDKESARPRHELGGSIFEGQIETCWQGLPEGPMKEIGRGEGVIPIEEGDR